jgi:hypothetical protein
MEIKKEIKQNNNIPAIADRLNSFSQEIGKWSEQISNMLRLKSGPEFFSKTTPHEHNKEIVAKLNQDIVSLSNSVANIITPDVSNLPGAGQ